MTGYVSLAIRSRMAALRFEASSANTHRSAVRRGSILATHRSFSFEPAMLVRESRLALWGSIAGVMAEVGVAVAGTPLLMIFVVVRMRVEQRLSRVMLSLRREHGAMPAINPVSSILPISRRSPGVPSVECDSCSNTGRSFDSDALEIRQSSFW